MRIPKIPGLLAVVCLISPAAAQDTANGKLQDWKITSQEAALENPLKPDEESLRQGKSLFESQCALCHGTTGDGKGSLAQEQKWDIRDLKNPETLKGVSDGAIFAMITKGKGNMPNQEGRLKDDQKWKLVNYIRNLISATDSPKTGT
ncbi:MAG: hypothetical protein A3F68_12935 [Acidobacteria bacterium RIFCSPLOWO2_12_FULL_54_10]|nr:MAG: hypothetical protein A3F68_12935 [Acidobacteria bacterium RIFCSPLOWO2_12_FULL_54_10]